MSGRTLLSACTRLSTTFSAPSTSIQTRCHSGRRNHSSSGSDRSSSSSTFISNGRLVKNSSSSSSSNTNSQSHAQSTPLILNINAGLGPKSLVTQASKALFSSLTFKHDLVEHDLWSDELISYNVSHMAAKMRLLKGKGTPEDEQLFLPIHKMAEELNAASVLVVSSPMWNFSFPYVLKQYIDIAVQPGINFKELPGAPAATSDATRPMTWDKHLVLVTSRGGNFGHNNPRDHFGLYLRDIFGMLGFTRAHEVAMEGAMTTPKVALLERAAGDAQMVANILNSEFAQWDNRNST